jgi:hypothetical protein
MLPATAMKLPNTGANLFKINVKLHRSTFFYGTYRLVLKLIKLPTILFVARSTVHICRFTSWLVSSYANLLSRHPPSVRAISELVIIIR